MKTLGPGLRRDDGIEVRRINDGVPTWNEETS
jgi:hypothetical protein